MGGLMQYKPRSRGVTLVEILIVSTIIAIMAALSFPVFKIVQQREKERRLKKILHNFRAAIGGYQAGNKNTQRIKHFQEGYSNYVRINGLRQIEDANSNAETQKLAKKTFIKEAMKNGLFYPRTIWHLTPVQLPHEVHIATDSSAGDYATDPGKYVTINVTCPFLRGIPVHPFQDWYPAATWTYRYIDATNATGVIQVNSSGAGHALDGSFTNDWD